MTECGHRITRGREGETGCWCVDCGIKVMDVETRPCGDCRHHWRSMGYSACKRHLMAVTPSMLVTFYLVPTLGLHQVGTCFEEAEPHDET